MYGLTNIIKSSTFFFRRKNWPKLKENISQRLHISDNYVMVIAFFLWYAKTKWKKFPSTSFLNQNINYLEKIKQNKIGKKQQLVELNLQGCGNKSFILFNFFSRISSSSLLYYYYYFVIDIIKNLILYFNIHCTFINKYLQ